ncbi:MAG: divalent cation tolerance protein CutA [Clostridiales bacterium]|nr:divalent cation tolerance protein CutA [Clostridiales bacterium]
MDFNPNKITEYKIEVFVPVESKDVVLNAIKSLNVGVIGNYYNCISCTNVISSWDSNQYANPFLGEKGQSFQTDEIKIETRCSKEKIHHLIEKIKSVHPYESVCINVIPILSI